MFYIINHLVLTFTFLMIANLLYQSETWFMKLFLADKKYLNEDK